MLSLFQLLEIDLSKDDYSTAESRIKAKMEEIDTPELPHALARLKSLQGDVDQAEILLLANIKKYPEHRASYLLLSTIYNRQERYEESQSKLLATVEQVKIASHNFSINARGIVGQDVQFNAIRLKDESEV